jgi:hypothetical protein
MSGFLVPWLGKVTHFPGACQGCAVSTSYPALVTSQVFCLPVLWVTALGVLVVALLTLPQARVPLSRARMRGLAFLDLLLSNRRALARRNPLGFLPKRVGTLRL